MQRSHTKLQRWTDLIAALLGRQYPSSFEDLARDVPAYADGLDPDKRDSLKRTFERDKDELREFGVPIESVSINEGDSVGYRLRPARFYLPYLIVAAAESRAQRRPEGYRALPEVTFEPDELALIASGSARLFDLGDPTLAEDARSVARKLAFDLPVIETDSDVAILTGGSRSLDDAGADRATFEALADALRHRKLTTFEYRAPGTGQVTERRVEPYGLFFISAHWYLAARDRTRDGLRNFRVSRIREPKVNKSRPQTADYQIPPTFNLREHAQSRSAWELGEDQTQNADVRFVGTSGAVLAASREGDSVEGDDVLRRFSVRRMDTFARWLLSFGGDAIPVAPPQLVDAYRALVRDTLAVYESGGERGKST